MPKLVKDTQLYMRLISYVKPYWRMFALAVVCMIFLAATDPALAALMKPMLDGAFIENDPEAMALVPLLLVGLFAVRGIASYVSASAILWVSNKVVTDLRSIMFSRLLSFPSPYFDKNPSGTLISLFTYNATQVKQASTNAIMTLVRDSLSVIGLIGWMFYINWQLTLIALVATPFITLVILVIRNRLRNMSRKVQNSMGDINHVLNESIEGNKLIKLFGGKLQETERFNNVINNYRHYEMKFVFASAASSPVVQLIAVMALASIIYIASRQAAEGSLSIGAFVSFFGAMAMLLGPLKRLVRVNEHIQRGLAACESIFSLLDEPVEIDEGKKVLDCATGDIEFCNVSFRYIDKHPEALSGLSLHIFPGQTVALVGSSGSGKTTAANLLPAFYKYNKGKILLDGIDIRDITLESLRRNIALVSQDVVLFNDTVRNNIAFGELREKDDGKIIDAAKAAYAFDFIQELPDGFDTIIGEKGLTLSGGQRQRLAIARALLKDAPILILDEATSSLDTETEHQIQAALENIERGRTSLIIAHRLSTIQKADVIVVIDRGKIVQKGTHEELLKQGGIYANLYQIMFSESERT